MQLAGRVAATTAIIGGIGAIGLGMGARDYRPLDPDPSLGIPGLLTVASIVSSAFGVGAAFLDWGGSMRGARVAGAAGLATLVGAYLVGRSLD